MINYPQSLIESLLVFEAEIKERDNLLAIEFALEVDALILAEEFDTMANSREAMGL